MALKAVCPHCHRRFEAPQEYAGRQTKCPRCGEELTLPSIESILPPVPQPVVITRIDLPLDNMLKLLLIFGAACLVLMAFAVVMLFVLSAFVAGLSGQS